MSSTTPNTPTAAARSASKARRPTDRPSSGAGNARGHGQASPRVRMMLKEEETRPAAAQNSSAAATAKAGSTTIAAASSTTSSSSAAQQLQEKVQTPPSRDNTDDAGTKTFLTALVAAKHNVHAGVHHGKSELESDALRPPSPLEPMDSDGYGASGEPCAANYMGGEAMQKFWRLFHRHDTISNNTSTSLRESQADTKGLLPLTPRPRSARSTYLSVVRKLQLSPEPLGIVRRRVLEKGASSTMSASSACSSGSTAQEINLNSYCIGNAYATAFSEGFALVPGVESLNLAHNRISDTVVAQIIARAASARPPSLQQLNLAHNTLARASSNALSMLLRQPKCCLTSLNVSHTQLRDRDVQTLCEALTTNQTLTRLHLSENRFGVSGMLAIAKFLEENAKVEEVYLAWNQLRGVGALKIVEALKFHASLRVLDLSWNALDSHERVLRPRAVVTALADALANNKVLAHLDLSNNHLDALDCAVLGKHLEANHSLVGLHMSGNCGVVDSRGFLIATPRATQLLDQHKMYSIAVFEESHSESGSGSFPSHVAPLVDRCCWYCGQWSEYRFAWRPTRASGPFAGSDRFDITPSMGVRVHLSHDDWRGVRMEERDDGSFSAYAILPPGTTEYFFTVYATHDESLVSHHYIPEKRHARLVLHNLTLSPSDRLRIFGDLAFVNVVRMARREGRDPCNSLVPRSLATSGNTRATRWDIHKSVFARRKRESVCRTFVDTDAFVTKACAADWRQCKVDRFVKDATKRKDVEACVTRHFRVTSAAYRRYCGHNVLTSVVGVAAYSLNAAIQLQNDVASVPWSGYIEFVTECRILDETSDFCSSADLENVFVAANLELTQEAKALDNPDRSLTRFEFLECVIRIAINKYHRTNVCDTPAKAVEKLIVEHLAPVCRDDPNEFRTTYLYTEEISDIFSEHIVMLQDIYTSNMGRYCKPGEKKGMQLAEFLQIMERYQVYCEHFRVRDVKDPFLACKLVVLDEMATAGHKKLYMTDFMELLLRVSVLRYPPKASAAASVADVAKSLLTLLLNHLYKHDDEALEQISDAVEQAVLHERSIEAFASAINAQKKKTRVGGGDGSTTARRRSSSSGSRNAQRESQIDECDNEDDDDDDDEDDEDDDAVDNDDDGDDDAVNGDEVETVASAALPVAVAEASDTVADAQLELLPQPIEAIAAEATTSETVSDIDSAAAAADASELPVG